MNQKANSVILIERSCEIEQQQKACDVFRKILNIEYSCDHFCQKIQQKTVSAIKIFSPIGQFYKIADIEELEAELFLQRPIETCFWIQSIEKLTTIVANRLLKKLEMPPQNVHFILTTKNSRLILPTILSRCTQKFLQIENQNNSQAKAIILSDQTKPLLLFFTTRFNLSQKTELEDLIKNNNFSEEDIYELLNGLLKKFLELSKEDLFWHNQGKKLNDLFELIHQTTTQHFIKLLFLELMN